MLLYTATKIDREYVLPSEYFISNKRVFRKIEGRIFDVSDIFSLFETSQKFIHAFYLPKIHFHKTGLLNLIKFMLKIVRVS